MPKIKHSKNLKTDWQCYKIKKTMFKNHFKKELYIRNFKITNLYLNFNVLSIDVLMSKELTACNYNCKGLR